MLMPWYAVFVSLAMLMASPAWAQLPAAQMPGEARVAEAVLGAAPPAPPAPATVSASPEVPIDYRANLESEVFGARLFTGQFARPGATRFNPDYALSIGDQVQIRLWGGFDFDSVLTVDPKGNLFLPHVGPVQVLGVPNQELQGVVEAAVAKVFRTNVYSYASLAAAQPVRVFVGGFVNRPGLYNGTSMDSLLHFLDQAGGIDPGRGSFLGVQVKRGALLRAEVNLYDFLLDGRMPLVQLADGDVIFVPARRATVRISGLAENANRFEFRDASVRVADALRLARPLAQATHVRLTRNTGSLRNVEYFAIDEGGTVLLQDGDELQLTADKKPGSITVRVEGEHESPQEYVLPYGTRLGDLLGRVSYSERSDSESIQLFRLSVKERQKQILETSLKSLESAALTARSGTSDEARLRTEEAALLLKWVERAREIEPLGQVIVANAEGRDELLLENGDVLRVPARDGLVLVSGEVLFPNAVAFDTSLDVEDYIRAAGGYTQNADVARVLVAHRDGTFEELAKSSLLGKRASLQLRPGDEILVLPRIDVKSRQIWKDMTQIIYQIAVSARVVSNW
jgi:protein involved in polysaccharide export with SLBB domain